MIHSKKLFTTICLVTVLSLSLGMGTRAHANNDESPQAFVTFFHSATGTASWVHFTPAPAGDPDTWSIKLMLPDTTAYAGADIHNVAGAAPPATNPPSFDFYSTITGASGGSPRLVMQFSDGGDMQLRPLNWVANTWTTESGTGSDWDIHSPSCTFLYENTYAVGLGCHTGATVTSVYIVTDSPWVQGPYTHYIDNIHYGSAFITSPQGGCHESDGNGDFQGDHGKGDFKHDGDGCMDGDQDQVSSTNRGDGRDFQSTQITTSSFDPATNTATITGVGTSGGVPVAFTFVALETGLTTPGWVSFAFSDGYTNAGTLLNGSILLH